MKTHALNPLPTVDTITAKLAEIRRQTGTAKTEGLSDDELAWFVANDPQLGMAVNLAHETFQRYSKDYRSWLNGPEEKFIDHLQSQFLNFYDENTVTPYVALNAYGPWIVTWYGAVLYECGGYGMLGSGHNPKHVLEAMNQPFAMANIMTPNVSQDRLIQRLQREVGHRFSPANGGKRPFHKFLCLNSGSESVTIASRISDVHAKILTDTGGRHAGKSSKFLAFEGAFHGRTERPAQVSDSSLPKYRANLASFAKLNNLITIPPNDRSALEKAFAEAERSGYYIEAMFMEPVMGEGNPGMAVTPEFYRVARKLTKEHGSLLIVDSIQAGLRAQGCLSLVDYPGFETLDPPDMETYSKAVNAGQFPLSILALNEHAAKLYRTGIYGNTMTANPRALEVACAVLDHVSDALRNNIRTRGAEFVKKLNALKDRFPGTILKIQGTGLLISLELDPSRYQVVAKDGVETYMRVKGINVIHGGKNALRLTPCFDVSSREIDLVVEKIADALANGPKKRA